MERKAYFVVSVLAVTLILTGTAIGASKWPTTVEGIALYRGADRQQMLEEGAKKEGKLVFYTTGVMTGSLGPFLELYAKKYPFIKLDQWRAGSTQVAGRVLEEYRAGQYSVDVIEATQAAHLTFQERGVVQPFYSPDLEKVDDEAITKALGGGALSAAFRMHGIGLGYNTRLMSRESAPKTYQDLLDPKWKGKLALSGGSVPPNWVGTLLKAHGEEFLKKIAAQNFVLHTMSGRALLDLIIAGEYPASPVIFDSHVSISKKRGAPVDWLPLEPVLVNITQVALPKHSIHPHAAMLLIDLEFSRANAELQKDYGYIPTRNDVLVERSYKKFYGATTMQEALQWQRVYNKTFLNR